MSAARKPRNLAVVPPVETLNTRIAQLFKIDTVSDEQLAELKAMISAKHPRTDNPDSVANLTQRYNDLVPTALALGIKGVLAALEAKIAEAQAPADKQTA